MIFANRLFSVHSSLYLSQDSVSIMFSCEYVPHQLKLCCIPLCIVFHIVNINLPSLLIYYYFLCKVGKVSWENIALLKVYYFYSQLQNQSW